MDEQVSDQDAQVQALTQLAVQQQEAVKLLGNADMQILARSAAGCTEIPFGVC